MHPGPVAPRAQRWRRLTVQTVIAFGLGLGVLVAAVGAGRLPARVRADLQTALGPTWSREPVVARAATQLRRFVAARSWGAVIAMLPSSPAPKRPLRFLPPADPEVVLWSYGWYRASPQRYRFHAETLLRVDAGAPVRAPAAATVVRWVPGRVTLSVGNGWEVTLAGLVGGRPTRRVHRGQVLGTALHDRLEVSAAQDGIPVSPSLSFLYGSALAGP